MSNTVHVGTPTGAVVHVKEELSMVNGALHLHYTVRLKHTTGIGMIYGPLVCTRGVNTQTMEATFVTNSPYSLDLTDRQSAASLADIVGDLKNIYGGDLTLANVHAILTHDNTIHFRCSQCHGWITMHESHPEYNIIKSTINSPDYNKPGTFIQCPACRNR